MLTLEVRGQLEIQVPETAVGFFVGLLVGRRVFLLAQPLMLQIGRPVVQTKRPRGPQLQFVRKVGLLLGQHLKGS